MKNIILTRSNNKQKDCTIYIGRNLLGKIGSIYDLSVYSKIFIITDQNIAPLFLKKIENLPIEIVSIVLPSGEKEKHIKTIQKIWNAMRNAQCDRKSLVINLGGGVICDMGGFAASTYMRGIDFINIPTTLLAQVDASIGGKTGINFSGIKNLIGTFNQPVGVVIDTQTLTTLPKRELLSGYAEIIKHGLIKNKTYFEKVTAKHPLKFTQDEMIDIIAESCKIKADIVQNDKTENNTRKLLNFGHTIGHAIEALSLDTSTPLLHGEAISIGMLVEAKISYHLNLLSLSDLQKIKQALLNAELPVSVNVRKDEILEKIKLDKKNERGRVNFTLLNGIGTALYNQYVHEDVIIKSLENILDL